MKPTKASPKAPMELIAYAVIWKDEKGLPWRKEFPATADGYTNALALETERNRINRAVPLDEPAPSPARLSPVFGVREPS